jgi:hypothetical protein
MVQFDAESSEIQLKYYFKSLPQAWAQMCAQAETMTQGETIAQVESMGTGTDRDHGMGMRPWYRDQCRHGHRHGHGHRT